MDSYYLTDTVFLQGDTLFHETDKGVIKEIKKHNWHHILSDYGWAKLPKKWITALNLLTDSRKEKNSLFGSLECEHDGDCFFHCIANALNERDKYMNHYVSQDIREMICDSLTEDMFETIIGCYRAMKDASDFEEDWNPHAIKSLEQFKRKMICGGHEYWGDDLMMNALIQCLNVNILILNSSEDDCTVYNTMNDYDPTRDSICLLYENESHFQLLGYFNGSRMISYFHPGQLPTELLKVFRIISENISIE